MEIKERVDFLNSRYKKDPYLVFEEFSSELSEIKGVCSFCNTKTKSEKMGDDEIIDFCGSCRAIEPETYNLIEIQSLEVGFNSVKKEWVEYSL